MVLVLKSGDIIDPLVPHEMGYNTQLVLGPI